MSLDTRECYVIKVLNETTYLNKTNGFTNHLGRAKIFCEKKEALKYIYDKKFDDYCLVLAKITMTVDTDFVELKE